MDNGNVVLIHNRIPFSYKENWNHENLGKWIELEKTTLNEVTQTRKVNAVCALLSNKSPSDKHEETVQRLGHGSPSAYKTVWIININFDCLLGLKTPHKSQWFLLDLIWMPHFCSLTSMVTGNSMQATKGGKKLNIPTQLYHLWTTIMTSRRR